MLRDAFDSLFGSVSKIFNNSSDKLHAVMVHDDQLRIGKLELKTIKEIGSGTYGVVKLVEVKSTRQQLAMKTSVLNPYVQDREIELLTFMNHPNVIRFDGFFFWDPPKGEHTIYQNMLFERMPEDLGRVLSEHRRRKIRLPELSIQIYCFQMFRGLAYLHAKSITHRDIKPSNLLVDPEAKILKISDFGCAKENIAKLESTPYMCSRYYRAPELVLRNAHHTEIIDVWAGACVLAECFIGLPIFPGRKHHQLGAICHVLGNPSKETLRLLNPQLHYINLKPRNPVGIAVALNVPKKHPVVHLLEQCFRYNPLARPTAWQVCSHNFFDEGLEKPDAPDMVFTEFESNSMPKDIRSFFQTKPRCKFHRTQTWNFFRSSESKLQRKRSKAVAMMKTVRARAKRFARKKLEEEVTSIADLANVSGFHLEEPASDKFSEASSCDIENLTSHSEIIDTKSYNELDLKFEQDRFNDVETNGTLLTKNDHLESKTVQNGSVVKNTDSKDKKAGKQSADLQCK